MNDLARFLLQYQENSRDNRYIRVSSLGFCSRKLGYGLLGYDSLPNSAHSQVILDLGNALHDSTQKALVRMGWINSEPYINEYGNIDCKNGEDGSGCEINITNHDLRIIGNCDGITVPLVKTKDIDGDWNYTPGENGEKYLIEIKSISDKPNFWVQIIRDNGTDTINELQHEVEFIDVDVEDTSAGGKAQKLGKFLHARQLITRFGKKVTVPVYQLKIKGIDTQVTVVNMANNSGQFTALKKPKPAHILQASMYAKSFGIDKILFIYIGKDSNGKYQTDSLGNCPIKIIEHKVKDLDIELIYNKINNIYKYVDEEQLPPREYSPNEPKSECPWCNFRHHCYPENIDLEPINHELKLLGKPELVPGQLGILHTPKKSLQEEYKNKV